MSTALDEDLDLVIWAMEDFMESLPCEHPDHDEDPESHRGPAQWYMHAARPCDCPCGATLIAVCDGFKAYIDGGGRLECGKCGAVYVAKDHWTTLELIGGKA